MARPPPPDPRRTDPGRSGPGRTGPRPTPVERLRALRPGPVEPSVSAPRLWRRLLIVAAMVAVVAAAQRGRLQDLSDRVFGARVDWASDYRMTDYLYGRIERAHLTPVRRACLLLNIHGGDPASATHLDVYERPTPVCMGPSHEAVRVLPRLFGLLVDRDTGRVLTDAGHPGRYEALPWL